MNPETLFGPLLIPLAAAAMMGAIELIQAWRR